MWQNNISLHLHVDYASGQDYPKRCVFDRSRCNLFQHHQDRQYVFVYIILENGLFEIRNPAKAKVGALTVRKSLRDVLEDLMARLHPFVVRATEPSDQTLIEVVVSKFSCDWIDQLFFFLRDITLFCIIDRIPGCLNGIILVHKYLALNCISILS